MTGPVLVTGGAGSVGRRLVERLLEGGAGVRVFDLPVMDFAGLEDREGIKVFKGDITECDAVARAVEGAVAVVHLAALLPPASEADRGRTFRVNVTGTEQVVRGLERSNPEATLVFTSSISTYGDTSGEAPPVRADHPQHAIDIYAESKIAGEAVVRASSLKTVTLRIAGIVVPAFLEPPAVWPFMPDQRVEMIHVDDVVDALFASATRPGAAGKVLNVAGGATWQLRGRDYVRDFYEVMGAPVEEAVYREAPGWMDWYDTDESQRILGYQTRSYQHYMGQMRELVAAMMAG